jgi:hypothetical protein
MAEDRASYDSIEKKGLTDDAEVEGHRYSFEPVEKKGLTDEAEPEVEGHMLRAGIAEKKGDAQKKA